MACERANEGVWSKVAHPIGRITLIPADGLYNKQKGRRHNCLCCDITNSPPRFPLSLCIQSPERLYVIPAQKGGQSEGLNTPTHPCFSSRPRPTPLHPGLLCWSGSPDVTLPPLRGAGGQNQKGAGQEGRRGCRRRSSIGVSFRVL